MSYDRDSEGTEGAALANLLHHAASRQTRIKNHTRLHARFFIRALWRNNGTASKWPLVSRNAGATPTLPGYDWGECSIVPFTPITVRAR